jgi:hypothetical protein
MATISACEWSILLWKREEKTPKRSLGTSYQAAYINLEVGRRETS